MDYNVIVDKSVGGADNYFFSSYPPLSEFYWQESDLLNLLSEVYGYFGTDFHYESWQGVSGISYRIYLSAQFVN